MEHHPSSYWEQPFSQPYFDNTTKRETTTTVGQSAYLHCRVRNLGDRAVSFEFPYCPNPPCNKNARELGGSRVSRMSNQLMKRSDCPESVHLLHFSLRLFPRHHRSGIFWQFLPRFLDLILTPTDRAGGTVFSLGSGKVKADKVPLNF